MEDRRLVLVGDMRKGTIAHAQKRESPEKIIPHIEFLAFVIT
jgi:hypothetical protein